MPFGVILLLLGICEEILHKSVWFEREYVRDFRQTNKK